MFKKLPWLYRLGLKNVLRVASYRLSLKSGWIKFKTPIGSAIEGPFFDYPSNLEAAHPVQWKAFGWKTLSEITPPNWQTSVFGETPHPQALSHWSAINDFTEAGDIKAIWENSRWDWLWSLALQYHLSKKNNEDPTETAQQNTQQSIKQAADRWLIDWSQNNPINQGPNWKCGQEASIRVIHLALASLLLEEHLSPSKAVITLLTQHLKRISLTIQYAIGQDNNHGTSEAAALYIGGSWLSLIASKSLHAEIIDPNSASNWKNQGEYWLCNRVDHLIETDGSFSQYSVNYHRLMLDTLSVSELWRHQLNLKEFPSRYTHKVQAASRWLFMMTGESQGLAPNIGANDGALLLPLPDTDYGDFRPSVDLAYALFFKQSIYDPESTPSKVDPLESDQAKSATSLTQLFKLHAPFKKETPRKGLFSDGGYAVLANESSRAYLRFPKFRFRPNQCDALHLDLFVNNENILRDGGSFAYHSDESSMEYFSGVESHNTVQFDKRQQMPKLSRFLWGQWLSCEHAPDIAESVQEDGTNCSSFSAKYTDWLGAKHSRQVALTSTAISISDHLSGNFSKAVLRWRLAPGQWIINGHKISGKGIYLKDFDLSVSTKSSISRFELVNGFESRYYGQKSALPVLEIEIVNKDKNEPVSLLTELSWTS